jgi:peroxiredoxin
LAGVERGEVAPSAIAWLGALSTIQQLILAGGAVVLGLLVGQWWFLLHLLRQNGRLLVRIEALEARPASGIVPEPSPNGTQHAQPVAGLPVGSEAPSFHLDGLHGETLTLDSVRSSGKPVVLLFTDPNCGPCNVVLPEIGRWQQEHAHNVALALVSRGTVEENEAKAAQHGLTNVLVQKDWEVSESYEVFGTPSAVLIAPDGKVASPMAGGAEGIRSLLSHVVGERAWLPMQPQQAQAHGQPCPHCGKVHPNGHAAAQQAERTGSKVGEAAPEVRLPTLRATK